MRLTRRNVALTLASAMGVGLGESAGAQGETAKRVPLQHFFQLPRLSLARLNPAGTHVALLVGGDGARRRLVVLDLASMQSTPVAAFQESDVFVAHWVNDRRLYLGDNLESSTPDTWRPTQGYAVDVDGGSFKRMPFYDAPEPTPKDLGDAVAYSFPVDASEGPGYRKLWRLDTRTGERRELDAPPWSEGFVLDRSGQAVAAVTSRGESSQLLWRDDLRKNEWRTLVQWERYYGKAVWPIALGADGVLYVIARREHDQRALYTIDTRTGELSAKPVLALAGFDIEPEMLWSQDKLIGVRVTADARTTVWFDADAKAVQAKVDAKLPATSNLLELPRHGDSPWVLVGAFSDTRPLRTFLYNRQTDKLTLLGGAMPHLDPATQSSTDFVHYTARDGRRIPAYLTLPRSAGAKPTGQPLVVWVHGGPTVRGASWGWNPEIQFLASRGYAVLQPEFRGGDGFGEEHLRAGFKQWGRAMQDDLADGVAWAVQQGFVDPKRVAIMGGSYGGYAAMMGLVRHPEVYRCAVNYVGVTDLQLMFSAHWSDVPGVAKRLGFGRLIGDPVKDADLLRAHSPVHQAHKITKPVLMAYGRQDQRVPIDHGERLRSALKHNADVEWVVYDKDGHGWWWQETRLDFWARVEKFLDRYLAPLS